MIVYFTFDDGILYHQINSHPDFDLILIGKLSFHVKDRINSALWCLMSILDRLLSVQDSHIFRKMIVQFQNTTIVYIDRSHTLSQKIVYFQPRWYTTFNLIFSITKDCFQSTFFDSNLILMFPLYFYVSNPCCFQRFFNQYRNYYLITRLGWSSTVWLLCEWDVVKVRVLLI